MRYYGNAANFGDLYEFVRTNAEMLDASDEAVENGAALGKAFELVHTGAGGDGKRFRLPTDTTKPNAGYMLSAANLGSCEWACFSDARSCVAIYFGSADRACAILYAPLILVSKTQLHGDSFLRRNNTGPVAPPPFTSNATSVAVLPRRASAQPAATSAVQMHLVDWRYAAAGVPMPPRQAPLMVSLLNKAVFGKPGCGQFTLALRSPGASAPVPLAGRCAGNATQVVVPAPRPWSILLVSPAKVGV